MSPTQQSTICLTIFTTEIAGKINCLICSPIALFLGTIPHVPQFFGFDAVSDLCCELRLLCHCVYIIYAGRVWLKIADKGRNQIIYLYFSFFLMLSSLLSLRGSRCTRMCFSQISLCSLPSVISLPKISYSKLSVA